MKKIFCFIAIIFLSAYAFADSEVSIGGVTGEGHIVQNKGVTLRQRPYLNITGDTVTCTDSGGKTVCTFSGGGTGDMQKSVYDTNSNNIVDLATALAGGETDPQVGGVTADSICQGNSSTVDCDLTKDASGACGAGNVCMGGHTHPTTEISGVNAGTDLTADLEEEAHAAEHAVGAADTVFPADPNADRLLMWDDDPGALAWLDYSAWDVTAYTGGDHLTLTAHDFNVDDDFLLNNGDVGTGVYDFGGATSLEIPNGASPTVDAAGETAIDTTSDQFIYYGGAKRIITYKVEESITVEKLAATDDGIPFGSKSYARTVTQVGCRCIGTCTTKAEFSFSDSGGNAFTLAATPTCATTGAATYQNVNAGGGLSAGEGMLFNVTNAVSPETDWYEIMWVETVDAD